MFDLDVAPFAAALLLASLLIPGGARAAGSVQVVASTYATELDVVETQNDYDYTSLDPAFDPNLWGLHPAICAPSYYSLCEPYATSAQSFADEDIGTGPASSSIALTTTYSSPDASLSSTLSPVHIHATGSLTAGGGAGYELDSTAMTQTHTHACGSGRSDFSATFSVSAPVSFQLTADLFAGELNGTGETIVRLTGPSGMIAEFVQPLSDLSDCNFFPETCRDPTSYSASGDFEPGTYVLSATTNGGACGFVHHGWFEVGGAGEGSYDIDLLTGPYPVPGLPTSGMIGLVATLCAAGCGWLAGAGRSS